jgi:hypothetical protein
VAGGLVDARRGLQEARRKIVVLALSPVLAAVPTTMAAVVVVVLPAAAATFPLTVHRLQLLRAAVSDRDLRGRSRDPGGDVCGVDLVGRHRGGRVGAPRETQDTGHAQ